MIKKDVGVEATNTGKNIYKNANKIIKQAQADIENEKYTESSEKIKTAVEELKNTQNSNNSTIKRLNNINKRLEDMSKTQDQTGLSEAKKNEIEHDLNVVGKKVGEKGENIANAEKLNEQLVNGLVNKIASFLSSNNTAIDGAFANAKRPPLANLTANHIASTAPTYRYMSGDKNNALIEQYNTFVFDHGGKCHISFDEYKRCMENHDPKDVENFLSIWEHALDSGVILDDEQNIKTLKDSEIRHISTYDEFLDFYDKNICKPTPVTFSANDNSTIKFIPQNNNRKKGDIFDDLVDAGNDLLEGFDSIWKWAGKAIDTAVDTGCEVVDDTGTWIINNIVEDFAEDSAYFAGATATGALTVAKGALTAPEEIADALLVISTDLAAPLYKLYDLITGNNITAKMLNDAYSYARLNLTQELVDAFYETDVGKLLEKYSGAKIR